MFFDTNLFFSNTFSVDSLFCCCWKNVNTLWIVNRNFPNRKKKKIINSFYNMHYFDEWNAKSRNESSQNLTETKILTEADLMFNYGLNEKSWGFTHKCESFDVGNTFDNIEGCRRLNLRQQPGTSKQNLITSS